jgi:hypothetical protein
MRFRWTIPGVVLSSCLTLTPAYADSHGRPAAASQHAQAQAPKATGKPTTTGKPTHGTTSGSTSTSTSTSPSTSTSTPLNAIAAKISSKQQLNTKIAALLPKDMTLNDASKGFRNQGLFIAALHVSQNLGCDCFKQLQTDITKKHMSLGQAIQDVKKTANSTVEVQKAETEANDDVKSTSTTTTTATSTSTAKNNKKKTTHGGGNQ